MSPIFLSTTHFNEDDLDVNFIKIADPDTYSMYCSHISRTTNVAVSCKAYGVPIPNISIYRESVNGKRRMYPDTFQDEGELVVGVPPLEYGEFIFLHCVASNIVNTVNISINLTYTCK